MGAAVGAWGRTDPMTDPATIPSMRRCRRGRGQHHLSGRSSAVATGALAASLHAALLLSHPQPAACKESVVMIEQETDPMTRMAARLHRHLESMAATLEEEASQRANDWLEYARDVETVLETLGVPMLDDETYLQPTFVEASPATSSTSIVNDVETSHRRSEETAEIKKDSLVKATDEISAALDRLHGPHKEVFEEPNQHIADALAGIEGLYTKKASPAEDRRPAYSAPPLEAPHHDDGFATSEKDTLPDTRANREANARANARATLPDTRANRRANAGANARETINKEKIATVASSSAADAKVFLSKSTPVTGSLGAFDRRRKAVLSKFWNSDAFIKSMIGNESAGPGAGGKVASESAVPETRMEYLQQ